MHKPAYFEIKDGYAHFAPQVHITIDRAVKMIGRAIAFCRIEHIPKLLVDITQLTGFEPPSVPDRFQFIRQWVEDGGGVVTLAMVARPEFIDPQKFGVMVANNRGLKADVFTNESDALRWLIGARGKSVRQAATHHHPKPKTSRRQ